MDERGRERPLGGFDEAIEIAVAAAGEALTARRHLLRRGTNEIRLIVDAVPETVTLDPAVTRIERDRGDNFARF